MGFFILEGNGTPMTISALNTPILKVRHRFHNPALEGDARQGTFEIIGNIDVNPYGMD